VKKKPTDFVQFKLRVRRRTLDKLTRAARTEKRSINAECIARLEASLEREILTVMVREMVNEAVQEAFSRARTRDEPYDGPEWC
jgi:hypothetical protein